MTSVRANNARSGYGMVYQDERTQWSELKRWKKRGRKVIV